MVARGLWEKGSAGTSILLGAAVEQLVNGSGSSTLSSSISAGSTSISVASAASFPSSPEFRIKIGDEVLKVTAVAGTTFTVTRGVEGTTAASHASGDAVEFTLTADGYETFFADYVSKGPWASRPSGSFAGQIYIATDSPYLSRYNGSAWEVFGPLTTRTVNTSGFAQVNGGTLTTKGAVYLESPAGTADEIRAYTKAYTAPATLIAELDVNFYYSDFAHAGVCFRDSSSGKLACHGILQTTGVAKLIGQKFSGPSSGYNSDYGSFAAINSYMRYNAQMKWMKLVDDNTNRIWSVSPNGRDWVVLHTVGRTDYLTPNEMGIFTKGLNNVATILRCTNLSIT